MSIESSVEVNFDGLIGPTHNYSGLSPGNLASANHALQVSQPRAAALQGIEKMRTLLRLGYTQGFLLPQLRPDISMLKKLGFTGSAEEMIQQAAIDAPVLLNLVYSASSMWAANAATVTPSADAKDGKVHFTPANLITTPHRAIEHHQTQRCLQRVFAEDCFVVHDAMPAHSMYGDEGAANHSRLCSSYAEQGVGLFVHGDGNDMPQKFPARQTRLASEAVARQQGTIDALYLQQAPAAIDAGAFHNDVVAVANGPVLFHHEQAYVVSEFQQIGAQLRERMPDYQGVCVSAAEVSLEDAIKSYLFNSQLLASPEGDMTNMRLVAPLECQENEAVRRYLERLTADTNQPIRAVEFVDVRQSMSNGGGPACLRLRVALTESELARVDPRFIATASSLDRLSEWVTDHYREEIHPDDLKDPALMTESVEALVALEKLLDIEGHFSGS